jgi:uncharacterized protein (TIGR03118 family)
LTSPTTPGNYAYTLDCSDAAGDSTRVRAFLTVTENGYALTSLVADITGTSARTTDSNLVSPWGVALPLRGAAVVVNQGGSTSTSYDGIGNPAPLDAASGNLVVHLPAPAGGAAFSPTGVVAPGYAFPVSAGGNWNWAQLIYVGQSGRIAAWAPSVDPVNAITVYTDAGGAMYTGAAVGSSPSCCLLYATDLRNGKIDVFDTNFKKQTATSTTFAFKDPTLPPGYAPFGIVADNTGGVTRLYVAYAKPTPDYRDAVSGAGLGLVDVFDSNGNFMTHLIAAGKDLNAPWGMAINGYLYVANGGDGTIKAFDPSTPNMPSPVSDSSGAPIVVPGIRGIAAGTIYANQAATLLFTAHPDNGAKGQYGRVDFGASPRLHAPPVVSVFAQRRCQINVGCWYSHIRVGVSDSVGIKIVRLLNPGNALPLLYPYNYPDNLSILNSPPSGYALDVDGNVGVSH